MGIIGQVATINTQPGGTQTAKNIAAPAVLKTGSGTFMRVVPQVVGTGGNLVINDNTQLGGSNVVANQLATIPFGNMTVGVPLVFELPFFNGLVVSAVTTGGGVFDISLF
jgi:hypothetical protein